MTWTCAELERWLDDGRPAGSSAAADAHLAACRRCSAALAAARSFEEALALPPVTTAPAGFTDAVMHRVVSAAPEPRLPQRVASSWWLFAVADPMLVTLSALAVLLAWGSPTLWPLAAELGQRLAAWCEQTGFWQAAAAMTIEIPLALRSATESVVVLGLAVGATPVLLWASWQLARWSERAVTRAFIRAVRVR